MDYFMDESKASAWLRLSLCPGIGPVTFYKLLAVDDPRNIVESSEQTLSAIGLKPNQVSFIRHQSVVLAVRAIAWQESANHHLLLQQDEQVLLQYQDEIEHFSKPKLFLVYLINSMNQ